MIETALFEGWVKSEVRISLTTPDRAYLYTDFSACVLRGRPRKDARASVGTENALFSAELCQAKSSRKSGLCRAILDELTALRS